MERQEREGKRQKSPCGTRDPETGVINLFDNATCTLDECTKVRDDPTVAFCRCHRDQDRDGDGDNDVSDNGDDSVDAVPIRKRRAAGRQRFDGQRFGGRREGGSRREGRFRDGDREGRFRDGDRQRGGKKGERREKSPCGTYNPQTQEITLNGNATCTIEECTKIKNETNQVFCKCRGGKRHDSSEDEDDVGDDDDSVDAIPIRKRRDAGRRRFEGQRFGGRREGGRREGRFRDGDRQRGGKKGGERREKSPCGTYNPQTQEITLNENATCTIEECTKIKNETNQVFCKCRGGRRHGSSEDEDEEDGENEFDEDDVDGDDGDDTIPDIDDRFDVPNVPDTPNVPILP